MAHSVVARVAGSRVVIVSIVAAAKAIFAEIIPDVLTADVGAQSVTPSQVMEVELGAASVVANLLPTIINVVVWLSVAPVVEVVLIIDEAAVITWVVHDWLEATNVGVDQGMNNRLCHCLDVLFGFDKLSSLVFVMNSFDETHIYTIVKLKANALSQHILSFIYTT